MPNPNDDDPNKDQTTSPSDEETLETETLDTEETVDDDLGTETVPGKKSAEARINELVSEVKSTKDELRQLREERTKVPTPPADSNQLTPEVQKAVGALKNLGFTQATDVDKKIQEIEDRMALNTEHLRLDNEFDGSDGRPKYDKTAVEDYMRKNGVYNPEVAYKAMHETELLDWNLKKAEGSTKKRPFVERTGSSSASRDDNTISREKIAEWMKTPEGRMKYEENRDKILGMVARGELT